MKRYAILIAIFFLLCGFSMVGATEESLVVEKFIVGEYPFDKFAVEGSIKEQVDYLIELLKAKKLPEQIAVIGSADKTGPEPYNFKLGKQRSEEVAKILSSQFPEIEIQSCSRGEQDNVREVMVCCYYGVKEAAATTVESAVMAGRTAEEETAIEERKFRVLKLNETGAIIEIPILEGQTAKGRWQVYASWGMVKDDKLLLPFPHEYAVKTKVQTEERSLIAYLEKPETTPGFFWPRIWAQELDSKEWLQIKEDDIFCRYSKTNKPAYEFLGDPEKDAIESVDSYPVRP